MASVITYALPTVLLVCCLVATGNSNPVDTNSGSIEATSQSPSSALPPGYEVYSHLGFAYKIHRESRSWQSALQICREEGAELAVIDSTEKAQALGNKVEYLTYTGIRYFNNAWRSHNTRLALENLPWGEGEPWRSGDGKCALLTYYRRVTLGEYSCHVGYQFICEIPYPPRQPTNQP